MLICVMLSCRLKCMLLQVLLVLLHSLASYVLLNRLTRHNASTPRSTMLLGKLQMFYLLGYVPLEVYCTLLQPLTYSKTLPFLPLLLTSVYSSVGLFICWVHLARTWFSDWQLSRSLKKVTL